jgi:hypothetical protein
LVRDDALGKILTLEGNMNRLFITALLASVAFAPAYAGKKDDNGSIVDRAERAAEKYDSRIDRLENRLEDAGDEERQRIENAIESITEKYEQKWGLPEEPPPPPPPPPDEDQTVIWNGSTTLFTNTCNSTPVCVSETFKSPVFHRDYNNLTVTYTTTGLQGDGTLYGAWTVNGNTWIPIERLAVTEGQVITSSFKLTDTLAALGDPSPYLGSVGDGNVLFKWQLDDTAIGFGAFIGDIKLTETIPPVEDPFVGY